MPPPLAVVIHSPDRYVCVSIVESINTDSIAENAIKFIDSSNRVLFDTSFISDDDGHGYNIAKYAWTEDSHYFIFSIQSSGEHQAWLSPTFIFSSQNSRIYNLDNLIGNSIVSPNFELIGNDSLEAICLRAESGDDHRVKIAISGVINKK